MTDRPDDIAGRDGGRDNRGRVAALREMRMTAINAEERNREALEWALEHTCLAIPPGYRTAAFWQWNGDDVQLQATTADGDFRFHVAAERRRGVKTRIAILSWEDDQGTATWEAEMPNEGRRAARAALESVMPGEPCELAPVEKCADCDGSGLALNMAGEPDVCPECRGDTVVPVELGEVERLREAARKARAVLAQAVSAGWNAGGPTLDDTDAAFWSLDAALAEGGRDE